MGVDTKGKIDKKYGVKDIQRALKQKFNIEATVEGTHSNTYYLLNFPSKKGYRSLSVFEQYADDETREIGTLMSFGAWGDSVELMTGIIEFFGGHIIEIDSTDDWKYISPSDKVRLSAEEIMEDKIFTRLKDSNLSFIEQQRMAQFIKINLDFIKTL